MIQQHCRDLRAFVWRKIEPKIVLVEKKRQISGKNTLSHYYAKPSIQALTCDLNSR